MTTAASPFELPASMPTELVRVRDYAIVIACL